MISRGNEFEGGEGGYIAESPLLPGVRWLRIELSRSVAMVLSAETKKILERGGGIGVRELWMLRWRRRGCIITKPSFEAEVQRAWQAWQRCLALA